MKGKESKKEKKKEKATGGKTKDLSEYQKAKQSRQDTKLNIKWQISDGKV
ncbi:hypothetical protein PSM36_2855 [Proteiniphilum saccharofermentans]|uniref:Uncharacterized protein n=1 Tax=Proteiniphilum saccharofermentans TaxID=1642647 RepID=A0A1R3T3B1_9BACT|nr:MULTISPECIES: hypothetical protein [Proteiniphilum]SCD21650.1 hypothetical protein PSM36_2855 [Proteiniphilum saccharofermentans]